MTTKMNCCKNPQIKDLTQGLGSIRHYYCSTCRSHLLRDKFYTAKEWFNWVNNYEHQIQNPSRIAQKLDIL